MREITIDLSACGSRQDLHEKLALRFAFPEWYGHNLDALHDCLTALGEPAHLRLRGHFRPESYETALMRVLADSARENSNFTFEQE